MSQQSDRVNPVDLAKTLNEIVPVIDSLGRKIAKADLLNPTSNFVQEIMYKLLIEIGMSEAMLEAPNMMASASSIPPNIQEALVLNVVCQKFFRRIKFHQLQFGLSDLTKPEGPRLCKFLWNISNFWLFVNANYEKVEAVKQRVEDKAKQARNIRSEIEEKANKRDQLRIEAETMKMRNDQLEKDIEATKAGMAQAQADCVQLQEASKDIKARNRAATDEKDALKTKVEKLEKEKKRLDTLVSMDQTKHSMEKEVKHLKDEHEKKELDIQRIKRDLQDLNNQMEELKARQGDMKELSDLKECIRTSETTVQQLQLEKQETLATKNSLNEELQAVMNEVRSTETAMAREAQDWAQRKASLECEIKDYARELESVRKGKTDAEIVAADLEQEIAKFKSQLESLEREAKENSERNATMIRTLMEQYRKFEAEVKETMESKLKPAFKKLYIQ